MNRASALLVGIALLWGATFVLTQALLESLSPHAVNFCRFGLASAALLTVTLIIRPGREALRAAALPGVILGLCNASGYWALNLGLLEVSAGEAAFIVGINVVIVPLLGAVLYRQRIRREVVLSVALTLAGLALFSDLRAFTVGQAHGALLFAASAFGLHVLLTGRYAAAVLPLPLVTVQMLTVTALSAAGIGAGGVGDVLRAALDRPALLAALLVLGLPATAGALLGQTYAQRWLPAPRVAAILLLEPVFGAALDALTTGMSLSLLRLLGAGLILLGIAGMGLGGERAPSPQGGSALPPCEPAKLEA